MERYYLEPDHDSAKSFYNKAEVRVMKHGALTVKVLTSYETEVAQIIGDNVLIEDTYSATTLRHIKEFLRQNGFKAESKKQIEQDYIKQ
jgi:hypothetical protein